MKSAKNFRLQVTDRHSLGIYHPLTDWDVTNQFLPLLMLPMNKTRFIEGRIVHVNVQISLLVRLFLLLIVDFVSLPTLSQV